MPPCVVFLVNYLLRGDYAGLGFGEVGSLGTGDSFKFIDF